MANAITNYFLAGPDTDTDMKTSAKLTDSIQQEYAAVFTVVGCFKGTFSLLLKDGPKLYYTPSLHVRYVLQDIERLQKQQITVPLGVDKTVQWCNCFMLVL